MSIATIMMPYMNALKTGLEAQNQQSKTIDGSDDGPAGGMPIEPKPKPTKWATDDYSNMDWGINWDKPSSYTPTNEYIRPWDREGWGANDVVVTPPRNPGNYVPPSRPGIQEGQRDYVFMPTEKEQWRIGDENKRRQALAVGKDWREARLPRKVEEKAPPVYGDWREAKLPERREVNIQPVPRRDREWGESRPGEGYIQIEGPGNPSWERRNPREREVTIQPVPRREIKGGGRGPSHKDFDHRGGFNTQALVPWINRETGEKWTAPDGGYSPREGSGWERERGNSKKDDRGYRVFPSDNESRKTRRPSLRDTLVGDMRRSWR